MGLILISTRLTNVAVVAWLDLPRSVLTVALNSTIPEISLPTTCATRFKTCHKDSLTS